MWSLGFGSPIFLKLFDFALLLLYVTLFTIMANVNGC